jgi:aryl-alcohol dehydrogenase-like predicted oxidoreductase
MSFIRRAQENGLSGPLTIQNPYNLLNRSFEVGLAEISMRENIGLLAYVNTRPFLWSNIIGATTMEQLRENIASVNITLPDDLIDEIEDVHRENSNPAP